MHLGFVSAILPDLDVDAVFATAAELGYDCVELMCWPRGKAKRRYAGVTHVTFDDRELARVAALSRDTGVQVSALGYYPNPLGRDPEDARVASEHIRRMVEAARELSLSCVNTFVGRDWRKTVDGNWPRFLEVWRPLIKHAENHDIRIGIENCPMYFTYDEWPSGKNLAHSPAIWRRMFADIPSPHFGINYDPSHMIWQHMDYLAPMREFASRLVHVHAKDARLDTDRLNSVGILAPPNEYHTPKLPGLGHVDWGSFFSVLTDTGYRGAVCVEVEDRAYEGSLDDRMAALRQSAAYLRPFVPTLALSIAHKSL